ncbi:MAG: nickel pincer cofactor biosynthesis protein LarB [Desulfovibrio sp.]|nr:nickel pincer cofactor biosynthesis protein LarB [Desulfovibrio sp.]
MTEVNDISGVLFDYGRAARIGLPEAVYSQGKPFPILVSLLEKFAAGEPPILFTRLDEEVAGRVPPEIMSEYDYDPVSRTAFVRPLPPRAKGSVGVLSAGSADAPVARECARTLEYLGIKFALYEDRGVAGLWRVIQSLPDINSHDAVIVTAGMEGALASVIGGLCPKPVYAVPTSIGYGAGANGEAALLGMLSSCASGVAVLNIDNGYGAACAAARVLGIL